MRQGAGVDGRGTVVVVGGQRARWRNLGILFQGFSSCIPWSPGALCRWVLGPTRPRVAQGWGGGAAGVLSGFCCQGFSERFSHA